MAINQTPIEPRAGLNTDSVTSQIGTGFITEALNAINGSFDGQQVQYQNEEGSISCFTLPIGYKCVGFRNIIQLNQTYYFLTNGINSLFGYVVNSGCTFVPLIDDSVTGSDLIGWNILYPIHKTEVKTTNCATQLYFTDRFNVRRYIDLNNLPFIPGTTQVDTNRMAVQPQFSIPDIAVEEMSIGGTLIEGDYQFAIQYADIRANGLTGFYSVTNPVRVFLEGKQTLDTNLQTNKAIPLIISGLDITGLYSYFNLAVIKTINSVTSVDYVGTFNIQQTIFRHTYTGLEQSNTNIQITLTEIFQKFEYYDIAGTLTQVDNTLVWADLIKEEDISYQKIWNQVIVHWGTSQVPAHSYGQLLGYADGTVCANYEGYFRDEVYALEGCFLFDNGKQSARFHIPGRIANSFDLQAVFNNQDKQSIENGTCPTPVLPRWKVYNTGTVTGNLPGAADPCTGIKPWQYGTMSYWESTDTYPANVDIWGTLANQPIRHHKFPDSTITHIHDSSGNTYPIGFKIDINSIWNALQSSTDLTAAQKRAIVGFKIMRSDRAGNNSIEAKGIANNCGMYTKDGTSFYYPNYPFNDVNPDPFISQQPVDDKTGAQPVSSWLQDFQRSRFTFHSPDTHFNQASGIQGAFLKLETAEWGTCTSHFVQVQDNAGEKLRTVKDLEIALAGGVASVIGFNVAFKIGVPPSVEMGLAVNAQNFFPTFNAVLEILDKLIPWYNYGWQYNGLGTYSNFTVIPDDIGNKIRLIDHGGYITSGVNGTFGDNFEINNTNRESSVYISTDALLPFTHEQVDINGNLLGIPHDNSRVTAGMLGLCHNSTPFNRNISSYYCSIKRQLDDQYGQIFSYRLIDTGTQEMFFNGLGNFNSDLPIVYGGDCFINPFALKIKHPFFLKSTVNRPDGYDIDYNQDSLSVTNTGNVGYPIWYYSTDNKVFNINNSSLISAVNTFTAILPNWINIFLGGLPTIASAMVVVFRLLTNGLLTSLGIKITNLECPSNIANDAGLYEIGQAYLYAYGIVNFFVESEVNVDMRHATNIKEGNFWPNVGTSIPDHWLQETNVSIVHDNSYNYNRTYSKQNHETAFPTLRSDWSPNQTCYINYNNRAIWSDQSSLEETKNNWLVYRPANLYDFPKGFGDLETIDRLESRTVLVRYQNHFQLYNALATVDTTSITAVLGTGALFSGSQPVDLNSTDIGWAGSQHKFLLNCEQGHIWCDAKRGKILLLRGTAVEELSGPKYLNSKYFSEFIPFQITNYFPTADIDNNFNGLGLHGVYDNFYKRFIITKLDYVPLSNDIQFDGAEFYINEVVPPVTRTVPGTSGNFSCCPDGYTFNNRTLVCDSDRNSSFISPIECPCCPAGYVYNSSVDLVTCCPVACPSCDCIGPTPVSPVTCPDIEETVTDGYVYKKIIQLTDPLYFCNKSLTISFSFLSNSWISWHSYFPNYYIEHENYFQSGYNDNNSDVWDHNNTFSLFGSFRGHNYGYLLETPYIYKALDQILQSIQDNSTAIRYTSYDQYNELNETVYFNKCTVYNNQQNTGECILVPKDLNNRYQNSLYPIYNVANTEILVAKVNHFFNINTFWDKVKDTNSAIWIDSCTPQLGRKDLVQSNIDYGVRSFRKYQINAKECKVRLKLDNRFDIKLISKFSTSQTQDSIQ